MILLTVLGCEQRRHWFHYTEFLDEICREITKLPDKIIFTIRKPGSQEKNTPSKMHYSPLPGSWIPYRKHMNFYEFNFVHLLAKQ